MPPAYRPGMVPRMALTPRIGGRGRSQLMNDLMGECPSLLDDLVFYPMWQGSQCVDMISGAVLENSANPVLPTDLSPNGEIAGRYLTADIRYLSAGAVDKIGHGDSAFSIASWIYPTAFPSYSTIITDGKTAPPINGTHILLSGSAGILMLLINTYTTNNYLSISYPTNSIPLNAWSCISITYDGSMQAAGCSMSINNFLQPMTIVKNSLVTPFNPGGNLQIGARDGSGYPFSGGIGATPIWRRVLSGREQAAFHNNGTGLRYPFRR